ncbi:Deaminase OS=Streptomyces griseorubiginosus OX=67304 GN=AQJ54_34485 PE=4 SV=1 [Streptomyces griseorubiginosus]
MSKVYTHMTMSLDGYIADPGDGTDELFGWYGAGDVTVPSADERWSFQVDAQRGDAARGPRRSRRSRLRPPAVRPDQRLGRHHPIGAPVVVVTHRAPDAAAKWPRTTFVDGVAERHPSQGDRR